MPFVLPVMFAQLPRLPQHQSSPIRTMPGFLAAASMPGRLGKLLKIEDISAKS